MPHMSKQVIFASTADFELLLKQVRKQYAASSKMQLGIPYPILTLFIPTHSLTNLPCSSRSLVAPILYVPLHTHSLTHQPT